MSQKLKSFMINSQKISESFKTGIKTYMIGGQTKSNIAVNFMDNEQFKREGDHQVDLALKNMIRRDEMLAINTGVSRQCEILGMEIPINYLVQFKAVKQDLIDDKLPFYVPHQSRNFIEILENEDQNAILDHTKKQQRKTQSFTAKPTGYSNDKQEAATSDGALHIQQMYQFNYQYIFCHPRVLELYAKKVNQEFKKDLKKKNIKDSQNVDPLPQLYQRLQHEMKLHLMHAITTNIELMKSIQFKDNKLSMLAFFHQKEYFLDQVFFKFTDDIDGDSTYFFDNVGYEEENLATLSLLHGTKGSLLTQKDIQQLLMQAIKEKFMVIASDKKLGIKLTEQQIQLFKRQNLGLKPNKPQEQLQDSEEQSPQFYDLQEIEETGAKDFIVENLSQFKGQEVNNLQIEQLFEWIQILEDIAKKEDVKFELFTKRSTVTGTLYGNWMRYQMMYSFYEDQQLSK